MDKNVKLKTYSAPGLIDLTLRIKIGSAWMCIGFTGGRSAGLGNKWAVYSTADSVTQHVIENSPEFKSGKIVLL